MRKTLALIAAAVALSMAACAPPGASIPAGPAVLADTTTIDERAALATELAYQASALALTAALRSGAIDGDAAERARALDRTAYAALLTARAAYDAGNAADYLAAADRARVAIAGVVDMLGGAG